MTPSWKQDNEGNSLPIDTWGVTKWGTGRSLCRSLTSWNSIKRRAQQKGNELMMFSVGQKNVPAQIVFLLVGAIQMSVVGMPSNGLAADNSKLERDNLSKILHAFDRRGRMAADQTPHVPRDILAMFVLADPGVTQVLPCLGRRPSTPRWP